MAYSFVVYIDESGDEGFNFSKPPGKGGSSRWFVLSAVIATRAQDRVPIETCRTLQASFDMRPNTLLHFSKLSHERRLPAIQALVGSLLATTSVIVHKEAIEHPDIFKAQPFRLYFYACRLLLERISWYCRDHRPTGDPGDGSAYLIFEHRKSLSYPDLLAYFDVLRRMAAQNAWEQLLTHDVRIHWPAIRNDQIEPAPKLKFAGLQLADCVAGALKMALDYTPHEFTEHRYAKMLKPVVYVYRSIYRRTNYLSYGRKFFPRAPDRGDPRGHWIRKHYS